MSQVTDTLDTLTPGSKVWVLSDEVTWIDGTLRSKGDDSCEVQLSNGQLGTFPSNKIQPANTANTEDTPDLTRLSYLNEPSVLHELSQRFTGDQIYTFAGPVLIALNPCKRLPLYTAEVAAKYSGGEGRKDLQFASTISSSSTDPHIFLVAAQAFSAMARENASQSLVISGESGAGKTETTKRAMQYFANLAGGEGIEERVMGTNPILEAFGNAKTQRNHNSSRFGKLIEIQFNHTRHICGAGIRTYLLEKSRVVHQLKDERSYHIFYQLVAGASPEERERYRLPASASDFVYLSKSGCTVIPGMDDAAEFAEFKAASLRVGLSDAQLQQVLGLVSGIMWLGNLSFKALGNDDSAVEEGTALDAACHLLGTTAEALGKALTKRQIKVGGDVIEKSNKAAEAAQARDALAKAIYSALFDWIVVQVNAALSSGNRSSGLAIAILDIFGFEKFEVNSFEQLCINFANERLQALFNRHIFSLQQQEYAAEGLGHVEINFEDNTPILDLIDARPPKGIGLLCAMDGACMGPKPTDEALINGVREVKVAPERISFNPRNKLEFNIEHFAGKLTYLSTGMLEKNMDTVSPDLLALMASSSQPLLAEVGQAQTAAREATAGPGGRGRAPSLGMRFSNSLKELLAALEGTGLHFVRCIKPNPTLTPNTYHQDMVLNQLRCCGVLEVVKLAKAGYPSRVRIEQFVQRYQVLLPGMQGMAKDETSIDAAKRMLAGFNVQPGQYLIGNTKIFFKPGILGVVDDDWARKMRLAQVVQSCIRSWHWRKSFNQMRRSAIKIQTAIRGSLARRLLLELRRRDQIRKHFIACVTVIMSLRRWVLITLKRIREREALIAELAAKEGGEKAAQDSPAAPSNGSAFSSSASTPLAKAPSAEQASRSKVLSDTLQSAPSLESKFGGAASAARDGAKDQQVEKLMQEKDDLKKQLKEKEDMIAQLQRQIADLKATGGGSSDAPISKTADQIKAERAAELAAVGSSQGAYLVNHLHQDAQDVTHKLEADMKFLEDVGEAEGKQPVGMDPTIELNMLSNKFAVWKADFEARLSRQRMQLNKKSGRASVLDVARGFHSQPSVNSRKANVGPAWK